MIPLDNFVIDNIFTDEEISIIYDHVNNTPEEKRYLQDCFGHTAYFSWLPESIIKKIEKVVAENFDMPLVLRELSFARYDTADGKKPALYPHFDETFQEQRVTVDIQVKSTMPWAIVVEDSPYVLKDNQALVFGGTHQIHWREKVEFSDADYVDMIFCHFSEPIGVAIPNSPEHLKEMSEKQQKYRDAYYAN
jgi:hypothetical protein